jgi:hypothetical protein
MDKAFNFRGKFTSDIAKKVFEDFGNKKVNLLIRELPEKGTPDNPIVLHGTTDEMREQIRKSLGYDEIGNPRLTTSITNALSLWRQFRQKNNRLSKPGAIDDHSLFNK